MPDTLESLLAEAVAAASWIEPTDAVAVGIAVTYARAIDDAVENETGTDLVKALYLGPHLLNTLKALGLAPAERAALAGAIEATKSKRDELKQKREAKRASAS